MRVALVVVALAGCWHDAAPDPTVAPIVIHPKPTLPHVLAAEFGKVVGSVFVKTSAITLVASVEYGWRIQVPCRDMIDFRETLKMPSMGEWSVDPTKSHVSADRTEVVTEDAAACFNGWIQHTWSASAGDPDGVYVVTVEIEGYTPVRFHPRFSR